MKGDGWKKELADLIKKHKLLPDNFTGQVRIVFNQGGIQDGLRERIKREPLKQ